MSLYLFQDVIKADKNNYTAFVFIGISAQELGQNEQALLAFKRAVKENPDQILAWQVCFVIYCMFICKEHISSVEFQITLANYVISMILMFTQCGF